MSLSPGALAAIERARRADEEASARAAAVCRAAAAFGDLAPAPREEEGPTSDLRLVQFGEGGLRPGAHVPAEVTEWEKGGLRTVLVEGARYEIRHRRVAPPEYAQVEGRLTAVFEPGKSRRARFRGLPSGRPRVIVCTPYLPTARDQWPRRDRT